MKHSWEGVEEVAGFLVISGRVRVQDIYGLVTFQFLVLALGCCIEGV